jgi:hypothetical protein
MSCLIDALMLELQGHAIPCPLRLAVLAGSIGLPGKQFPNAHKFSL